MVIIKKLYYDARPTKYQDKLKSCLRLLYRYVGVCLTVCMPDVRRL